MESASEHCQLMTEYRELRGRTLELKASTYSDEFGQLAREERLRRHRQLSGMETYLSALYERIEAL